MRNQTRINLHFDIYRWFKSIVSAQKRPVNTAGITLVEVMIVVAIIGILTTIAVPTLINYRNKAQIALVISEIKILEQEIKLFEIKNLRLPDELSEVPLGNINDPWGNPYQYLKIAVDAEDEDEKGKGKKKDKGEKKGKPRKDHFLVPVNSDFDLYSMGKDGKSNATFTAKASHDDILRANDGNFIGLVADF